MNDQVINKEKILPMVTKKGYLSQVAYFYHLTC
nr:MAG TPA: METALLOPROTEASE, VIBRIO CHOLERAE, PRTV, N-TERMINAL [Caudoviricetes sp.]